MSRGFLSFVPRPIFFNRTKLAIHPHCYFLSQLGLGIKLMLQWEINTGEMVMDSSAYNYYAIDCIQQIIQHLVLVQLKDRKIPMILVGNKIDLEKRSSRSIISWQDIHSFHRNLCKNWASCQETFATIVGEIERCKNYRCSQKMPRVGACCKIL